MGMYKFILNALPIIFPVYTHHSNVYRKPSLQRSLRKSAISDSVFDGDDEHLPSYKPLQPSKGRRQARLSVSAQAHQEWIRKRTRWWYALFAGAIAGGVAINFEKHSRRLEVAQQMFVRYASDSQNGELSSVHNLQRYPRILQCFRRDAKRQTAAW